VYAVRNTGVEGGLLIVLAFAFIAFVTVPAGTIVIGYDPVVTPIA
jgi:hypothetical protein